MESISVDWILSIGSFLLAIIGMLMRMSVEEAWKDHYLASRGISDPAKRYENPELFLGYDYQLLSGEARRIAMQERRDFIVSNGLSKRNSIGLVLVVLGSVGFVLFGLIADAPRRSALR